MATLLPNARQTFTDQNGAPLAGGSVTFYVPGTSTLKNVYQDAAASILSPNPVILDAAGQCQVYGTGSYRQVVKDEDGNILWDQPTQDASASGTSWAGTSTGSANAQIVTAPNFASQDGQSIEFIAGFTNTAAAALVPNGTAGVPIRRNSVTGPAALTGGEIVQGNVYRAVYAAGVFLVEEFDKAYVDGKVSKSGDAMTGTLNMSGNAVFNLPAPAGANDAARKTYVDGNDAATLSNANGHADAGDTATLASAKGYSDGKFPTAVRLGTPVQQANTANRIPGTVMTNVFGGGGGTLQIEVRALQFLINGNWITATDA